MTKNILITGSNGQLGSEIRALAATEKHRFVFTDIAELDITDKKAVERMLISNGIDFIINCAAYTQVDKAEEEIDLADRINRIAVQNLAAASRSHGIGLVHISTDYVFDGTKNIPYLETDPTSPLGAYGKTKLAGEQSVIESGCHYLIIRTSWLYSSFGQNFMHTIRRLTAEKDTLKVVFDQVGTPTYARDLAKTILQIIRNETWTKYSGIYHFSNEGVCSWYDFALEIRDLFENRCNIVPCHSDEFPSKVTRPNFSVLDKTKIKTTFGLEIAHWKTALKTCVKQVNSIKSQ